MLHQLLFFLSFLLPLPLLHQIHPSFLLSLSLVFFSDEISAPRVRHLERHSHLPLYILLSLSLAFSFDLQHILIPIPIPILMPISILLRLLLFLLHLLSVLAEVTISHFTQVQWLIPYAYAFHPNCIFSLCFGIHTTL